jgi:hypothetical protein
MAVKDLTGPELLRRRIENRCLNCGEPGLQPDTSTGFPDRYCGRCQKELNALKRKKHERPTPPVRHHTST